MILNLVLFLYPFLQTVVMSFYDWPILGAKKCILFDNYARLFGDEQFIKSLVFTLKYALFVTPSLFLLAFLLAIIVNGTFRGVSFFRSIYYAPVVISMTCCSMVWLWIYNDLYGVLNYLLQRFHIIESPVLWMNAAETSLPAIIFMITWKMAGFTMLIILAAFQSVDEQIYEAASVDGANTVTQFFSLTLPIIRPQVALALIMSVIGSVLAFEQFLIMTKGGPAQETTTIVHYIYNTSFKYFKMGYGSSMTVVLLIILGVFSYFQYKIMRDPTIN
jgi:multiple sugar transport system permease protein